MGLFSWFKRAGTTPSEAAPGSARVQQRYDSVELMPGHPSCPAVKELAAKRFLGRQAPRLPLPDCNRPDCSCSYRHHEDRRCEIRRAGDHEIMVLQLENQPQKDRRRLRDRRRARAN